MNQNDPDPERSRTVLFRLKSFCKTVMDLSCTSRGVTDTTLFFLCNQGAIYLRILTLLLIHRSTTSLLFLPSEKNDELWSPFLLTIIDGDLLLSRNGLRVFSRPPCVLK